MRIKIWLAIVAAGTVAGCYKEMPLETMPPIPATRIIAEVTDSGTVALSNFIGPGATQVEGVVNSADRNTWTLEMLRVDHRDGRTVNWNHELVRFAPNLLVRPTVKVLDKRRSWLAAGGITVGALVLARTFGLIGANDDTERNPGEQPQQIVIPVGGR